MKADRFKQRVAKKFCHVTIEMIPDNGWRATYDMDNLRTDMSDKNRDDINEISGIYLIRKCKI